MLIMTITQLYSTAEKSKICIDEDLHISVPSMACEIGDFRHIGLQRGLTESQKRECMAHEIGHHKRGALYCIEAPIFTRAQCEQKANNWAAHKLMPWRSLEKAVRLGYTEAWQLAEYFDVSEDFVRKAVEIYAQEGKTIVF